MRILTLILLLSNFCFSQEYLPFNHEGKWGVINQNGEQILKPTYSSISPYHKGVAVVGVNGMHGLIDSLGNRRVRLRYYEILPVSDQAKNTYWKARDRNGYELIDSRGLKLSYGYFSDFTIHGQNYLGTKNEKIWIGILGDTSNTSPAFDEVESKSNYFLCENENDKFVLNKNLNTIAMGDVRSVRLVNNCFVINQNGVQTIFTYDGEEIINGISNYKAQGNFITGYHLTTDEGFIYSVTNGELTFLGDEQYMGSFKDNLILSSQGNVIIKRPNGSRVKLPKYSFIGQKGDYLLLGQQSDLFTIYNSSLKPLVKGVDLVTEKENHLLYRKNGMYGLINQGQVIFDAQFNYFDISRDEIKAYSDKGLLYVVYSNGVESDRTYFENFISLKGYGNIPSTQLSSSSSSRNSNGQFSSSTGINHFWEKDTIRYTNKDNNRVVWGIKKDTFILRPRYTNYTLLTDQYSRGNYFSNSSNVRLIGNVPTDQMFDLVDHINGVKLNKRPYFSFNKVFPRTNYFVVRDKKHISVIGPSMEHLYADVSYINATGSGTLYPFCREATDLKFTDEKNAHKDAIKTRAWLDFLGDNNRYPNDTDFEKIESVYMYKGKWGFMNDSARVVIPADYDMTYPMNHGIGIGKKAGKYGAVNGDREILPTEYDKIDVLNMNETVIVRAMKLPSSKELYIDSLGNSKEADFRAVMSTWKNDNSILITIEGNGLYGMIDRKGRTVIRPELTMPPIVKSDYIITRINRCGVHDFEGNLLVDHAYRKIEDYRNGLVIFRQRNKYGVGDGDGEVVIPADYDHIELGEESIYCEKSSGSVVFDYNGNRLSKEKWQYSFFDEKRGNWIYRNNSSTIVQYNDERFRFNDLNRSVRFLDDYLLIEWGSGQFNLHHINEELTPVFTSTYSRIEQYNDSIFYVYDRNKFGLRTQNDEEVIPIRYRSLVELFKDTLAGIYANQLSVYNLKGELLFQRSADVVLKSDNQCFLVKDQGEAIFYSDQFKNKFFSRYTDASPFKGEFGAIKKDGFWTVINKYGNEMFEPCFGSVVPVGENLFYAKNRFLTGVFDTNGNEILPVKYDEIIKVSESILRVIDDGNLGYYNIKGYWVLEPGEIPSALTER